MMGEIGRARQRVANRPQCPTDRLARRVAHQEGAPARAAIAGHRDESANIVQSRLRLAIDHLEGHAGQEDAIEEAREMRREQASRIVVPDAGGGLGPPPGGGKIKF